MTKEEMDRLNKYLAVPKKWTEQEQEEFDRLKEASKDIVVPDLTPMAQHITNAIMNSPGVRAEFEKAEQIRKERNRHIANIWVAIICAFLALALAFVIWLYPHLGEEIATWITTLFQKPEERQLYYI